MVPTGMVAPSAASSDSARRRAMAIPPVCRPISDQIVEAAVSLGDLVGHAGHRSVDVGCRHHLSTGNEYAPPGRA